MVAKKEGRIGTNIFHSLESEASMVVTDNLLWPPFLVVVVASAGGREKSHFRFGKGLLCLFDQKRSPDSKAV